MTSRNQRTKNITLNQYISYQRELIKLDYQLETREKQKTEIPRIDLCFILRSKAPPGKERKWATTLPLPKNLIPPEYLIMTDPSYVNVSDKIRIQFLDCDKEQIEGTVMKIRDGELTAIFDLKWREDSARHKCSVVFLPNDVVYNRKLNALRNLKRLNEDLKKMLCRIYPKQQKIPNIDLFLPPGYDFNDSQKKAIRMAVSNPFSLIQGPPGTGKTHTIGAIAIQALHQNPNKKVLICGTTNVSISSLLEIVGDMVQIAGFKVCWPAASARDFTSEKNLTKEQKLMTLYISRHMNTEKSRRFNALCEKYKKTEKDEIEMKRLRDDLEVEVIRQSNVIFSTLDSSGKRSIGMNIGDISTLVVDEATLSVESSMIIPLSLCPDRLILVGDHKQLGPQSSYDELKNKGYYYSMFERIIKEKTCLKNSVMLSTQYRMHQDISRLPNHLFYDDELIDGVRKEDRQIAQSFVDTFKIKEHLNFINFESQEEKNGTSYINQEEISQVFKFVNALISSGVDHSQIGVISAYGAQTSLISEKFRNASIHVKISTIDSFQGSQKDYIIICTTRNGTNLGFLNDQRRMNVAITRARRLVVIFGNADTLIQSKYWGSVIEYAKENKAYFGKLPAEFEKQNLSSIKVERRNTKQLTFSKKTDNVVKQLVLEFKEEESNAGYKLREVKSEISDSEVRVLWPDEKDDIKYLNEWVQKRVNILNDKKHVTLAYDAEGVCMQFGDIFDNDVDYYNWESYNQDFPEIKTNESIIISFYKHSDDYSLDPSLVNIMKPLLEHQRITLITFDFTFDFDKLYNFGINIKTNRIIDVQLMYLPEDTPTNADDDFICSTGWKSIAEFICQSNDDNDNSNMILRAKKSIKNNKKKFPHEENNFLINQFKYPPICQFTKIFLEYSAGDIFYTAIAAIDVLSRGELDDVKERSIEKFGLYKDYRKRYGCVSEVRSAYYVRESFTSAIQVLFSKENQTYQILSYYRKLNSFVSLLDKCPKIITDLIPSFNDEDDATIRQRYDEIVKIMTNQEYEHLGNIKDNAILSYVPGIKKIPAFVFVLKEEETESAQENTQPQNIEVSNQQKADQSEITNNEKPQSNQPSQTSKEQIRKHRARKQKKNSNKVVSTSAINTQQEQMKISIPANSPFARTSNSNSNITSSQQAKILKPTISALSNNMKTINSNNTTTSNTQQEQMKVMKPKNSSLAKMTPRTSNSNNTISGTQQQNQPAKTIRRRPAHRRRAKKTTNSNNTTTANIQKGNV